MAFIKRIVLFMAVNMLVMLTISLLLNLIGVQPYLTQAGLNYQSLAVFCLIWGMAGSLVSLALSRVMAKWTMGVRVIDPHTAQHDEQALVQMVHQLARAAALPKMPEVGIYESPELNAFATGPTRSRALVAVSSGLLRSMDQGALQGVLGHEIAHVANGDMVTMTLLQGVVNAFVMFLSRVIAFAINQAVRNRDEEGRGLSHFVQSMIVMALEMVFMLLGTLVVAWFSRQREYRADKGGAQLAGKEHMIAALENLKRAFPIVDTELNQRAQAVNSLKISGHGGGFLRLFSTHPDLDDRIEKLRLL